MKIKKFAIYGIALLAIIQLSTKVTSVRAANSNELPATNSSVASENSATTESTNSSAKAVLESSSVVETPTLKQEDNKPKTLSRDLGLVNQTITKEIDGINFTITETRNIQNGVTTMERHASLGDINNIYAVADASSVRDMNGRVVMPSVMIPDVGTWVRDVLGEDLHLVLTSDGQTNGMYFIHTDGTLLKSKIFKDGSDQAIDGDPVEVVFDQNNAGQEVHLPLIEYQDSQGQAQPDSLYAIVNQKGRNFDLNFADLQTNEEWGYDDEGNWTVVDSSTDLDINTGMLFAIPTTGSLSVSWVDKNDGTSIKDPFSQKLISGSSYMDNGVAIEGYTLLGKAKSTITSNSPISDDQIDTTSVMSSGNLDFDLDSHYFDKYYLHNYLDVGASYTSILQDYKDFGWQHSANAPIYLTVTRLNEAGDVKLDLFDKTSGTTQSAEIKHGQSYLYNSNENDFWYQQNGRTFYNNIQLQNANNDVYVYNKNLLKGSINIQSVDEEGNSIWADTVLQGDVGESYSIPAPLDIPNYTYQTVDGEVSGEFTESNQVVTYIYTHNKDIQTDGIVVVNYKDTAGNIIAPTEIERDSVGNHFTLSAKTISGYHLSSDGQISGTYSEDDQVFDFIYDKDKVNGQVIVKYLDQAGKELAPQVILDGLEGNAYQTESKNISGYRLVKKSNNVKGKFIDGEITVYYSYEKIDEQVNTPDDNSKQNSDNNSTNNINSSKNKSTQLPAKSSKRSNYFANSSHKKQSSQNNLPQTGEQYQIYLSILGIILLLCAGVFASYLIKHYHRSRK